MRARARFPVSFWGSRGGALRRHQRDRVHCGGRSRVLRDAIGEDSLAALGAPLGELGGLFGLPEASRAQSRPEGSAEGYH